MQFWRKKTAQLWPGYKMRTEEKQRQAGKVFTRTEETMETLDDNEKLKMQLGRRGLMLQKVRVVRTSFDRAHPPQAPLNAVQ